MPQKALTTAPQVAATSILTLMPTAYQILEGNGDTDANGIPDYLDTDSDNDGISDADEDSNIPALSGNDTDHDGIGDALDVDATGGNDANGNGLDDAVEPQHTDGDGKPDHLDTDRRCPAAIQTATVSMTRWMSIAPVATTTA